MSEKRPILFISILVIFAVTFPYIYTFLSSNKELVFGGFLINPVDGHSYLAKMYQGLRGDWKFVLPYSAIQGEGAYIFVFYIALGHLARLLGSPLIVMFHVARLFSGAILLWAIWLLTKSLFSDKLTRILAFTLCVVGSGLGWIAVLFGKFTSDFWVAEAYPFLSMYTNPHFSFGLALLIIAILPNKRVPFYLYLFLGAVIAILQPFAMVVLGLIFTAATVAEIATFSGRLLERFSESNSLKKLLFSGFGGGVILLYQLWVINSDPVLAMWNEQNITSSPDIIDLVVSFSPCLVLAFLGLKRAWKNDVGKLIVFWFFISLSLIFIPWNLQRRFLSGLFVPIAGLAVFGLDVLNGYLKLSKITLSILLICLVIPTNLIILLSGINAAVTKDPKIYLNLPIIMTLEWIDNNVAEDALILADEETGLLIPSQIGRRVVYGHPFETTQAEMNKSFINQIFGGGFNKSEMLKVFEERDIDYIFSSEEYYELNRMLLELSYFPIYQNADVVLFNLEERQ